MIVPLAIEERLEKEKERKEKEEEDKKERSNVTTTIVMLGAKKPSKPSSKAPKK